MNTARICPACRKALAVDAPHGVCPECLLKAGLQTEMGDAEAVRRPRFIPPSHEELASRFPQLEIMGFLGQGGMGAVYKARQKQLDRIVALKILPPQVAEGSGFAERFTREAQVLAKLNHPNIVTLYEFGQADGLFYFLMEFVEGRNLQQLMKAKRLAPHEALAIVPQICDALQFAHMRGVVHRDIKPGNILLSKEGQAKIADFGVAKIISQDADISAPVNQPASPGDLTNIAGLLGTPDYMAPEQVSRPLNVDHRADIFALGVVFYEMLTGQLPLGKFAPPSACAQDAHVDARLDDVVLRALEKEPERRYQQANQVKTALQTIANTPRRLPKTSWMGKRFRAVAAAISIVALVAAAIVLFWPSPFSKQFQALEALDNWVIRDTRLGDLAKEAARAGDAKMVQRALRTIVSTNIRDDGAIVCARLLANSGERSDAFDVAKSISWPASRNFVLAQLNDLSLFSPKPTREISRPASSELGREFETLKAIEHWSTRDVKLSEFAEKAARAGDFKLARYSLETITSAVSRDSAAIVCARLLVEEGKLVEARQVAQIITWPESREMVLKQLDSTPAQGTNSAQQSGAPQPQQQ